MKAEIVPPYLTILTTSAALPEGADQTHLFLKAVGLLPTPGGSFRTDSIEIRDLAYRIIVYLTEVAPRQPMAVEPTPSLTSISLGRPSSGLHVVEIHARSADEEPYTLRQAFVLEVEKRDGAEAQPPQANVAEFGLVPEAEDDDRPPKKEEKSDG